MVVVCADLFISLCEADRKRIWSRSEQFASRAAPLHHSKITDSLETRSTCIGTRPPAYAQRDRNRVSDIQAPPISEVKLPRQQLGHRIVIGRREPPSALLRVFSAGRHSTAPCCAARFLNKARCTMFLSTGPLADRAPVDGARAGLCFARAPTNKYLRRRRRLSSRPDGQGGQTVKPCRPTATFISVKESAAQC